MNALSGLSARLKGKTFDAAWEESKHPRKANGQFGSGGSGKSPAPESPKEEQKPTATSSPSASSASAPAKLADKMRSLTPTISPQDAEKILEREMPIPKGFFIHGRSPGKKFGNSSWPTQYSLDVEVAKGYAGEDGEIYISRPKPNAIVADFTSENSPDMDAFINRLKDKFETPQDLFERAGLDGFGTDWSWGRAEQWIRDDFTPSDIVSSAQAYDAGESINILEFYPGGWPDFIYTPDGAVMLPGSENMVDSIRLK